MVHNTKTYIVRVLNEDRFEGTVLALAIAKQGEGKTSWGYKRAQSFLELNGAYLYTTIVSDSGNISKEQIEQIVKSTWKNLKQNELPCPKFLDKVNPWEEVIRLVNESGVLQSTNVSHGTSGVLKASETRETQSPAGSSRVSEARGTQENQNVGKIKKKPSSKERISSSSSEDEKPPESVTRKKGTIKQEKVSPSKEIEQMKSVIEGLKEELAIEKRMRSEETEKYKLKLENEQKQKDANSESIKKELASVKQDLENERNTNKKQEKKNEEMLRTAQEERDVAVMKYNASTSQMVDQVVKVLRPQLITTREFENEVEKINESFQKEQNSTNEIKEDLAEINRKLETLQQSVITEQDIEGIHNDIIEIKENVTKGKVANDKINTEQILLHEEGVMLSKDLESSNQKKDGRLNQTEDEDSSFEKSKENYQGEDTEEQDSQKISMLQGPPLFKTAADPNLKGSKEAFLSQQNTNIFRPYQDHPVLQQTTPLLRAPDPKQSNPRPYPPVYQQTNPRPLRPVYQQTPPRLQPPFYQQTPPCPQPPPHRFQLPGSQQLSPLPPSPGAQQMAMQNQLVHFQQTPMHPQHGMVHFQHLPMNPQHEMVRPNRMAHRPQQEMVRSPQSTPHCQQDGPPQLVPPYHEKDGFRSQHNTDQPSQESYNLQIYQQHAQGYPQEYYQEENSYQQSRGVKRNVDQVTPPQDFSVPPPILPVVKRSFSNPQPMTEAGFQPKCLFDNNAGQQENE